MSMHRPASPGWNPPLQTERNKGHLVNVISTSQQVKDQENLSQILVHIVKKFHYTAGRQCNGTVYTQGIGLPKMGFANHKFYQKLE